MRSDEKGCLYNVKLLHDWLWAWTRQVNDDEWSTSVLYNTKAGQKRFRLMPLFNWLCLSLERFFLNPATQKLGVGSIKIRGIFLYNAILINALKIKIY